MRYGGLVFSDADHHDAQLLVDLINSHYLGDGSDALAGAGATRWLREHIGQHRLMPAASALLPLRELREGLRQLAIGNNGGVPDRAAVARADAALRHAPLVVRLAAADGPKPVGPVASAGPAEQVVAVVGMAYLASQGSGAWRRVKACAEPGCRWAFLDLSRNGSRRWCDMAECGNRAKNRTWRARHPNQRY
jgi:predicted RNA-binding Zn ribbon-like protein